ncbi:unnamed protein product, partial [Protopolystoma xenopodis]
GLDLTGESEYCLNGANSRSCGPTHTQVAGAKSVVSSEAVASTASSTSIAASVAAANSNSSSGFTKTWANIAGQAAKEHHRLAPSFLSHHSGTAGSGASGGSLLTSSGASLSASSLGGGAGGAASGWSASGKPSHRVPGPVFLPSSGPRLPGPSSLSSSGFPEGVGSSSSSGYVISVSSKNEQAQQQQPHTQHACLQPRSSSQSTTNPSSPLQSSSAQPSKTGSLVANGAVLDGPTIPATGDSAGRVNPNLGSAGGGNVASGGSCKSSFKGTWISGKSNSGSSANTGGGPNATSAGGSANNRTTASNDAAHEAQMAAMQRESEALHQRLSKQINPSSFDTQPARARFFVIKSFSEDDIHRSIKYAIWCSTELGNKKLDSAFVEIANQAPIYLFFSVNGSGHFCGMAEMTSRVDYTARAGVWAQDKWQGKFTVKWIFVKDVPNTSLRHIRIETNENKPVTHSRDTTEIPLDKGRQVMDIFAKYDHATSIFDDFLYYEQKEREDVSELFFNFSPTFAVIIDISSFEQIKSSY